MCDCRQGARLAVEYLAPPDAGLEASARQVADLVRRTRARLPAGVQAVIGVSPFVSSDLSHAFDQYQQAFCLLLQEVLSTHPGVAAIEVAEAHSIREELAGTTETVAARRVPAMVTGEYSVQRDPSGGVEPVVRHPNRRWRKEASDADEAPCPHWRCRRLFRVRTGACRAGYAWETRNEPWFPRRSRWPRFPSVPDNSHAWEHGRKPAACGKQRSCSIRCRRVNANSFSPPIAGIWAETSRAVEAGNLDSERLRRVRLWPVAQQHLEYLIRNRLISHGQACDAVHELGHTFLNGRLRPVPLPTDMEKEKKAFLLRSFEPVRDLASGDRAIWGDIHKVFLKVLLLRLDGHRPDDEDLLAGLELVRQFRPTVTFTSHDWRSLLGGRRLVQRAGLPKILP